jgi:hypothetical protein
MKKPSKPQELTTTIQIESWRQRLTVSILIVRVV